MDFVCNYGDDFVPSIHSSAGCISYNCAPSMTPLGELDSNLQFAGDPSCGVICDIMHTIWSIELLGHQRHLTSSAEPEVMQSHWPHFQ